MKPTPNVKTIPKTKQIARMKWTLNPVLAWRRTRGRFRDPLFVYQMGKVGSTTIEETLEARYRYYHLHNRADFSSKYEPYRVSRRTRGAEYFDIITAVRDPLARKISCFFQHLAVHPVVNPVAEYPFCFESVEAAQNAGMDELIARFHAFDDGVREATEWFDRHFEPATGIRIYDHGFDPEKGWQIFREGKWRVLVLRFEDIKKNYLDALNEFVVERYGEPSRVDRLWPANLSSRKWYFDLMHEFRQNIRFSETDIDAAYNTPYARYFYSDQELTSMRSKWRTVSTSSAAADGNH
ncbi:putative capsular polysaccharide synthesis family protein [Mycobacterium alsense]|uniref:putative capsular polysaccharide synthesis family protein n=1 Tax=Mycobacterium alsense TaxID=324058 RepID=UPI0010424A52|nr:putative capsular polysaccharide synthesis family protein [Mycobacterium alsense]